MIEFCKRDGGVAIYYKDCCTVQIIKQSENDDLSEFLIIELTIEKRKLALGVVYKPPVVPIPANFFNEISDLILSYSDFIITGDVNMKMNEKNDIITFRRK